MNVLRVTQGLAEIDHVHQGDLEVIGGVALLVGRVTGDVVVHGGRLVVSGIIDGNLDNRGGAVRITGTILGSITGSPAYTVLDISQPESSDPFATWDPVAAAGNAAKPKSATSTPPHQRRNPLWTVLTTAAVGVATIGALAAVGDNAAIAEVSTGDEAVIIQVVEKPSLDN